MVIGVEVGGALPRWRVGRVYRHNAGGALYAPVDRIGDEYGVTPSYDHEAVQRFVDYLNGSGSKYDFTAIKSQRP